MKEHASVKNRVGRGTMPVIERAMFVYEVGQIHFTPDRCVLESWSMYFWEVVGSSLFQWCSSGAPYSSCGRMKERYMDNLTEGFHKSVTSERDVRWPEAFRARLSAWAPQSIPEATCGNPRYLYICTRGRVSGPRENVVVEGERVPHFEILKAIPLCTVQSYAVSRRD